MSPIGAAGSSSLSGPPLPEPEAREPIAVDDTAESAPDTAALYAQALSRRVELSMLAAQSAQQQDQVRLDRLKATFNQSQEERSEMLREMNALRDMALEQSKQDDEVLKKYIAMI